MDKPAFPGRHPGEERGPEEVESRNERTWIPASGGMTKKRALVLMIQVERSSARVRERIRTGRYRLSIALHPGQNQTFSLIKKKRIPSPAKIDPT